MIYIYQILSFLLIPFIKLNILIRIKKGKELKHRYRERFGIINYPKKHSKKIIWIHAASVGEFKSIDCLINAFFEKYTLLVTTTTVSAANYAAKHYSNKVIHQFAPLDIFFWVKKFLNYWKPTLIIWIESDLWPTTLNIIKKQNIKSILINLRMSPKSFNRWKKFPSFYIQTISCFSKIYAQSKIDQDRIKLLTKRNINFIGNLKLATSNNYIEKLDNSKLIKNENIITIMISSTHNKEESQLMPVLKNLLDNFNNLNIIIAPRHPERSKNIKSLCSKFNLSAYFESEKSNHKKGIIIINSFGILQNYFASSDIVFLGGSLISAGGHNPIEPAFQKCAILTGTNIFNWQNIFDEMIINNACIKIQTTEELTIHLNDLINNKKKLKIMKTNAYNFALKQFVDTKILEQMIINYMNSR